MPNLVRQYRLKNENPEVQTERVKADIADVVLEKVFKEDKDDACCKDLRVTGVSKHLCGAATDFALQSIANFNQSRPGVLLVFDGFIFKKKSFRFLLTQTMQCLP